MPDENIKRALQRMDGQLIAELIEVAQLALNDTRTVKRIASETACSIERVEALGGLAVELSQSTENAPSIRSVDELDEKAGQLHAMKADYPSAR